MSVEAITWALKQPVPHSTAKFVLVVLANCARSEDGLAYPSVAYLCDATGQDRKTVIANLARLIGWGLVDDSGERAGRTRQVVVYHLNLGPDLLESIPKTEPFQKRNSSVSPTKQSRFSAETVPKTGHGTVNNHQEPKKQKQPPPPATALPDPPEWLSRETWDGFVTMRSRIRHPLTAYAARLVFKALDGFRGQGMKPDDVLDQSTRNGWRDVFALREATQANGNHVRPSMPGKQMQGVMALEDMKNAARQRMAARGDSDGPAETLHALAGPDTRR